MGKIPGIEGGLELSVDERIENLIEQANRAAAGLDSLNNKLTIVAADQFQFDSTGVAGEVVSLSQNFSLNYAPIFIAYYNLSSEPGIWRYMPDMGITTGGVIEFVTRVYTNGTGIFGYWATLSARAACTVTIKWFLLKEPAQNL